MKRVALVTSSGYPRLTEDDRLLLSPLRALEIEAKAMVWDDASADWPRFDQVILRSCWDYHLRLPEFLAWIAGLESRGVALQNSASLVRWNADKRYLRSLQERGTVIPETQWLNEGETGNLTYILAAHGWDRAVVKPTVSATAYKTRYVHRRGADQIVEGPLMVQEYLPEIEAAGEWSLIFLGGEYSHAVRKYPAAGDFRVQHEFGGRVTPGVAHSALIEEAARILAAAPEPSLYARVDGVEQGGRFILMELELIEPALFLEYGGVAERFAQQIALSLRQAPAR